MRAFSVAKPARQRYTYVVPEATYVYANSDAMSVCCQSKTLKSRINRGFVR